MPTARSGRRCSCAAARTWSARSGLLQSFADLLKFVFKEPSSRPAPTRASSCWRRWSPARWRSSAWAVIPSTHGWVDRRHQCRHPLHLRHLVARRLRHHHGRLGVELEIPVPRRAALGGADGVLRSLDRLRHHHRAALRRLAEPLRHRRAQQTASDQLGLPSLRLALAAAVPDVRRSSSSRRWPRPTARPSTCRRRNPSSSPASWSNIPRRRTCCSCSANTSPSS